MVSIPDHAARKAAYEKAQAFLSYDLKVANQKHGAVGNEEGVMERIPLTDDECDQLLALLRALEATMEQARVKHALVLTTLELLLAKEVCRFYEGGDGEAGLKEYADHIRVVVLDMWRDRRSHANESLN